MKTAPDHEMLIKAGFALQDNGSYFKVKYPTWYYYVDETLYDQHVVHRPCGQRYCYSNTAKALEAVEKMSK